MKALPRPWLMPVLLALVALALPLQAEETAADKPWQAVISSQIQAFRDHDAPVAFELAGVGFQTAFPDAETFFAVIISAGYGPIMDSRSHSFGEFQLMGEMGVIQQVKFIGNDQTLYEALYQLTEESAGWRVQGVQLLRPKGVAV